MPGTAKPAPAAPGSTTLTAASPTPQPRRRRPPGAERPRGRESRSEPKAPSVTVGRPARPGAGGTNARGYRTGVMSADVLTFPACSRRHARGETPWTDLNAREKCNWLG